MTLTMKSSKSIFLLALILIALSSCTTEEVIFDFDVQLKEDIARIDDFVAENNLQVQKHHTGFSYIINDVGQGEFAMGSDILEMKISVFLLDSTFAFSTTENQSLYSVYLTDEPWFRRPPVFHDLAQLIKTGGKAELFVPSGLAWGTEDFYPYQYNFNSNGLRTLFANTNVLISAELVEIRKR